MRVRAALALVALLAAPAVAQVNTLSITSFTRNLDGSVSVVYEFNGAGGLGLLFSSESDLHLFIDSLNAPDAERVLKEALGYWRSRDEDLSNTTFMRNKTLIEDWGANNPIRVQ